MLRPFIFSWARDQWVRLVRLLLELRPPTRRSPRGRRARGRIPPVLELAPVLGPAPEDVPWPLGLVDPADDADWDLE